MLHCKDLEVSRDTLTREEHKKTQSSTRHTVNFSYNMCFADRFMGLAKDPCFPFLSSTWPKINFKSKSCGWNLHDLDEEAWGFERKRVQDRPTREGTGSRGLIIVFLVVIWWPNLEKGEWIGTRESKGKGIWGLWLCFVCFFWPSTTKTGSDNPRGWKDWSEGNNESNGNGRDYRRWKGKRGPDTIMVSRGVVPCLLGCRLFSNAYFLV
jgi:hypothetical protein